MADEERTVSDRPRSNRPAAPRATGGTPIDRFELGEEIARGGMGRVVEARDRVLGRYVAIKQLIDGDDDAEALQRFRRETAITARLEHPSIVPLYDTGRDERGLPYYVMRRVDGRRLTELVTAATTLEARLALIPNVLAACDAIAHAHVRGVIHRDIKPGNILVGELGETIVIDWGLAKVLDEAEPERAAAPDDAPSNVGLETVAGVVMGTPGYMPPEQLRGDEATTRTDVYALGATLYHTLAGRPPHAASSSTEMLEAAKAGPPTELEEAVRGVPQDLTTIVRAALARDPAARFASAVELAAELRRFLTGQLVAAHHYSWRERMQRFLRRHRVAVGVTLASLVAIAAIAGYAFDRVVASRDRALDAADAAELARQREAERGDELLIERARLLASKSTLGAITQLDKLRPGSASWRRAHGVAAEAATYGVPWAIPAGDLTLSIAITRDAAHAYSSTDKGEIWVHDLVGRSSSVLRRDAPGALLALLDDDRTLVIGGSTAVVVRDLASGRETTSAVTSPVVAVASAAHAYGWLDKAGRAFVVDPPGSEPIALAPVPSATGLALSPDGQRLALFGARGVFVIEPRAPGVILHHHQGSTWDARWSPDGATLGIADQEGGFVLRWSAGTLRDEQVVGNTSRAALFAAGEPLFAASDNFVYRPGTPTLRKAAGSLHYVHAALAEHGAVFDTGHRELVVVGPVTERVIRLPGTPLGVAAARARAVVAIPGRVLIYELGGILPRAVAIPASSFRVQVLFGDAKLLSTAPAGSQLGWTLYDLDGGSPEPYGTSGFPGSAISSATDASYLAFKETSTGRFTLLRRGGRRHDFPATVTRVQATTPQDAVIIDGDRVERFEVATATTTPLVEVTGASALLLATSPTHVAIATPAPALLVVELATGRRSEVALPYAPSSLRLIGGVAYVARDTQISAWDGRRLVEVANLVAAVARFAEVDGRPIAIDRHGSTWRLDTTPPRHFLPPRSDSATWSADGARAVSRSIDGEVWLHDLANHDRWELPLHADNVMLGSSGTRLVVPYAGGVAVYDLPIPSDAAAYRRDLARLTNLRVDDMDDVLWPW